MNLKIVYISTGEIKQETGNNMSIFGLQMSGNGNVTNASMAYLPYWNYTPMAATNFGGDLQIFPVDTYQSSQIGMAFNNLAQQAWGTAGIFGGYQMTPSVNPAAVIGQASQMAATSLNQMGSQYINQALQTIAGQKSRLQAQLNDKNLKADEKAKIQEQIKQLEEYEKQLNDLKKTSDDPMKAYQKAAELNAAVTKAVTGQNTTPQSADTQSGSSTSTGSTDGTSSSSSTSSTKKKDDKKHDPDYTSYADIIDDLHDSMFRPGTNDELLESSMSKINKDNIIDIMTQWNQAYPGESLMEAFMADAGINQKRDYGRLIQRALRDKATELGMDLTHDKDYKAICKEMNSWFWINNGVADNYNALIKRIAEKESKKYEYEPYSILSK